MSVLNLAVVGHVDHGKSTVVGRLLADMGSVPDGRIEAIRRSCEKAGRPFEYAFLLDALREERAQGITIDTARIFFETPKRRYQVLDAPGHIEFLKNMVTGASNADAAFLVIDAKEGIRENSIRHAYLLPFLGVQQIAILINKMDLIGFDEAKFQALCTELKVVLDKIGVRPRWIIPIAALSGLNMTTKSSQIPWYQGPTVLEALDEFQSKPVATNLPLRMPIQGIYKFSAKGDQRRIVAGTLEAGQVQTGEEVVFYPSGKKSRIRTLEKEGVAPPPTRAQAGEAVGFTLTDEIYLTRGEILARPGTLERPPEVRSRFRASVFWLGAKPLSADQEYILKLGTDKVGARIERFVRSLDVTRLEFNENPLLAERFQVTECVIQCDRAIAFDRGSELPATGRFVIVDDYEICGGGLIEEALEDEQTLKREKILLRNLKWEPSLVPQEDRSRRYRQKSGLILITGKRDAPRKEVAKELERELFEAGRATYYLGLGSLLYGLDADLPKDELGPNGLRSIEEHLRRLGEVANILLDAGLILIVSAIELTEKDLATLSISVPSERIRVVWMGERTPSPSGEIPARADLQLKGTSTGLNVSQVIQFLNGQGFFPPKASTGEYAPKH